MTIVLLVLNLVLSSFTTVITNESGKTQIKNSTEFIIIEETIM